MSVLAKLSSMFTRKPNAKAHTANGQRGAVPFRPVRMDADDARPNARDEALGAPGAPGSDDADDRGALATPRNKQELIVELQKNYTEVLELVRKVNTHLDRESERTAKLMTIVERIPDALDALPELRDQTKRAVETLRESSEQSARRDEKVQSALTHIRDRLDDARETETHLVGTLTEFRGSLQDMAHSSERSSGAIAAMNERNALRDKELADMLNLTRRWVVAALVIGALGVAAAIVAIAFILTRG
ncbi:MAG: hypothetical protein EA379_10935 [Phycisphaerales bacterium]|nr:MAG: hypothetical protein EA379_10935 [Phycisphaerales bacterium]